MLVKDVHGLGDVRFVAPTWGADEPRCLQGEDWVDKRPEIRFQGEDWVDKRAKGRLEGEDWLVKRAE